MASYSQESNSPQISVCGSEMLTIFGFLSHNFRSRYASKSIKGCKDQFSSQDSKKTLSEKNSHWPGAQGQEKLS